LNSHEINREQEEKRSRSGTLERKWGRKQKWRGMAGGTTRNDQEPVGPRKSRRKIRLGEDRSCRFCRAIVVLLPKKWRNMDRL